MKTRRQVSPEEIEAILENLQRHRASFPSWMTSKNDPFQTCTYTLHLTEFRWMNCRECSPGACQKFRDLGLDHYGRPLPMAQRPLCAARTRAGSTCRHPVLPGFLRCRFHGGKSTGPKTAEGKAAIAKAQRERWQRWREAKA